MNSVTRQVQIDAPAPEVWRHISDPAERRRWFGGDLDVDLSPGGQGTFAAPDEDRPVRVDDVEAGRSVTFTWGADDDASQVRIEVEPDGDGSRVTVTETAAGTGDAASPPTEDGSPVASLLPGRWRHHDPDATPDVDDDDPRDGEVAEAPGGWAPPVPLARAA